MIWWFRRQELTILVFSEIVQEMLNKDIKMKNFKSFSSWSSSLDVVVNHEGVKY
jgi:hypothetical protein